MLYVILHTIFDVYLFFKENSYVVVMYRMKKGVKKRGRGAICGLFIDLQI